MAVLNVLAENTFFDAAQTEDAAAWRRRWRLTFPVLADEERAWVAVWGDADGGMYDQHSYTLLDADGIVLWRREGNETYDNAVWDLVREQLEALEALD